MILKRHHDLLANGLAGRRESGDVERYFLLSRGRQVLKFLTER
jgi:hypothetical protein